MSHNDAFEDGYDAYWEGMDLSNSCDFSPGPTDRKPR